MAGRSGAVPQALLYLGRSRHALGQYPEAVQAFTSFLRQKPDSAAGHFFLGRSHLALGALAPAVKSLRRAISVNPGMAPAWGLLGLAFTRGRSFDRAVQAFSRALQLDPQNPRLLTGWLNATLVQAVRLFYQGSLVEAGKLFQEVLRFRERSLLPHLYLASIYRELGKHNLALFHMDSAVRLSPQDPFLRLQKSLVLLAQGSHAAAIEEIRAGSALLQAGAVPAGDAREVLRFLAINLFRQKRYKEAIFNATKLLRMNYADPPLHVLMAQCFQATGDLGKAQNHYERALEVDKDSAEVRQGLMAVLWESGDTRELARHADILLRKDPRDEVGLYFAGLALSRNGGPAPEVLAGLQALIRSRGPDPVLMTELGSAYLRAGMPELAVGWLERSLKLQGEEAGLLAALAGVYGVLGRADKEAEVTRRYLQVRPEDAASRRRMVRLLLDAASWAEASGHISTLLAAEPRNPRLLSLLALCFRRTQRYADALVVFRDLLAAEPRSQEHAKGAVYCLDRMGSRAIARAFLASFMKDNGETEPLLLVLGVLFSKDGDRERAAAAFRRALALSPRSWRAYRNLAMIHRSTGNSAFAETFMARARQYRQEELNARKGKD